MPKRFDMNTVKQKTDKKKKDDSPNMLSDILSGRFLSGEKAVESLPFILFLTLLGILYIGNGYYAEKTVRDLYKANTAIKELRSEYITNKSELEIIKQQSHVAIEIQELGLKEPLSPPKKIVVEKDLKEPFKDE